MKNIMDHVDKQKYKGSALVQLVNDLGIMRNILYLGRFRDIILEIIKPARCA